MSDIDASKLLICWVHPRLADIISDTEACLKTPTYFQKELSSLAGRPAHGRLWSSSSLPDIEVAEAFEDLRCYNSTFAKVLEHLGGIVIRPEDRDSVLGFGLITDQQLDPYYPHEAS